MLLVDTDPGLDDAHAIAMAVRDVPASDLLVTTVAGNTGIEAVTENASWLLGNLAPDVPLHRGAAGPLLGRAERAEHIHGRDGLGGVPRRPDRRVPVREPHAANVIVEAARRHGPELRVVALGPLTNVALALALEPELPEMLGGVVAMGGTPAGRGNASVNAEFNVFADPEAAEAVLARIPVTLVTWDLSLAHRFTAAEMAGFVASGSPAARLLGAIHEHRLAHDPGYASSADFGRADALAMAVALDPACVTRAVEHAVLVGTGDGLARGVTAVDWGDHVPGRPKARIPLELDAAAVRRLLTL